MIRTIFTAALTACLTLFATAAHADPRDFTLVNGTSWTIRHVYVAPSYSTSWGEDVLSFADVLSAGGSTFISFPNPAPGVCLYDVRVIFHGDTSIRPGWSNINLCATDRARIWYNKSSAKYILNH